MHNALYISFITSNSRQLIGFPVQGQLCCSCQGEEPSTIFQVIFDTPYNVTCLYKILFGNGGKNFFEGLVVYKKSVGANFLLWHSSVQASYYLFCIPTAADMLPSSSSSTTMTSSTMQHSYYRPIRSLTKIYTQTTHDTRTEK